MAIIDELRVNPLTGLPFELEQMPNSQNNFASNIFNMGLSNPYQNTQAMFPNLYPNLFLQSQMQMYPNLFSGYLGTGATATPTVGTGTTPPITPTAPYAGPGSPTYTYPGSPTPSSTPYDFASRLPGRGPTIQTYADTPLIPLGDQIQASLGETNDPSSPEFRGSMYTETGVPITMNEDQLQEEEPPIPWWMIANMFKPPVGGPGWGMFTAGKNIGRIRGIQEDIDTGEISADKGKKQKRWAGVTAGLGFLHEGVEQAKNYLLGRGTSTAAAHAAKEQAESWRDLMQEYTSNEKGQKDLLMNMLLQNTGAWAGSANFLGQQGGQIQNLAEGGQIPQYQIGSIAKAMRTFDKQIPSLVKGFRDFVRSPRQFNKRTMSATNTAEEKMIMSLDNRMNIKEAIKPGEDFADTYSNIYMHSFDKYGNPTARDIVQKEYMSDNFFYPGFEGPMYWQGGQIPQYQIGGGSKYPSMTNPDTAEMKQHKKAAIIAGRYPSASNKEKFLAKYDPEMRRLIEYYSQMPSRNRLSQEIGLYDDIYRAEGKWSMEPLRYAGQQTGSTLKEISNYLFRTNFQQGGQIQNLQNGGQKVGGFKDTMSHFNTAAEEGLKKPSVAGFYRKDKNEASMEEVASGWKRRGLDPDHPMYEMANAELEHGEKVLTRDEEGNPSIFTVSGNWHANKKVSKKGKKNGQTGELFALNEGDLILSNYRRIGKEFAKQLKEGLGIRATKNTTFAKAMDMIENKGGISPLYALQTENFKKLVKNTEDLDTNLEKTRRTKEFNDQYLSKKMNDTDLALQDMKPMQVQFFHHLYAKQEEQKQEEEQQQMAKKLSDFDGQNITYARKGGTVKIPITFKDGGVYTTPEHQEAFNEWAGGGRFKSPMDAAIALRSYFQTGGRFMPGLGASFSLPVNPASLPVNAASVPNMVWNEGTGSYDVITGPTLSGSAVDGSYNPTAAQEAFMEQSRENVGITGMPGYGVSSLTTTTASPSVTSAATTAPAGYQHILNRDYRLQNDYLNLLGLDESFWRTGVLPTQHEYGVATNIYDFENPEAITTIAQEVNPWFFGEDGVWLKKNPSTSFDWSNKDHVKQYQRAWNDRIKTDAEKRATDAGLTGKDKEDFIKDWIGSNKLEEDGLAGNVTLTYQDIPLETTEEAETKEAETTKTKTDETPELDAQAPPRPGFLPNLLTQFRMPPRPLQGHAYALAPHRAVSPFEIDPTAAIVENNRMFSAAMDQIGQMPGSQVGANTGNLLAKVADANNKAVLEHGRVNLQSAMQAQQLNQTMFQHADQQRFANLMSYDQLQLTALDKTMTEYKNYLETMSSDAIQRQKEQISLAIADSLAPQFTFNPWGGITHIPGSAPKFVVMPEEVSRLYYGATASTEKKDKDTESS